MTTGPKTLKRSDWNSRESWIALPLKHRSYFLENLTEPELHEINSQWKIFAHAHQIPPALAPNGNPWHTWLMIGGRGAGKTRAGAEWVRAQALGLASFSPEKA